MWGPNIGKAIMVIKAPRKRYQYKVSDAKEAPFFFFFFLLFSRSVVSDSFVTQWTVARQAPLSTRFPRQEYWSGLPSPSPRELPYQGIKPASPVSPALQTDTTEPPGKPGPILPHSKYVLLD